MAEHQSSILESDDIIDAPLSTSANVNRHEVVHWLDARVKKLLQAIQREPFWLELTDPATDTTVVRAIMRQVYLEIVGYQPDVIAAAIASIGQMPRSMDPRLVRSMLVHQADEFDHGEMALRDYVGTGMDEAEARAARISPEAFAVAGVWWMIVHRRDPFAYLGALYLFEGLTPTVTAAVKSRLQDKGFGKSTLEYIDFHSTEDIKHANLVEHLISTVAWNYPHAVASIKHGYECFEAVYPLPLWRAAHRRATEQRDTTR